MKPHKQLNLYAYIPAEPEPVQPVTWRKNGIAKGTLEYEYNQVKDILEVTADKLKSLRAVFSDYNLYMADEHLNKSIKCLNDTIRDPRRTKIITNLKNNK
jgi:hypothetical protein